MSISDEALSSLAKKYIEKGRYKEALKLLSEIKTDKFLFSKYNNSGICYRCLEKYNLAIEAYNKALEADPKKSDITLHNIGNLYCDMGRYDESLEAYNKASEMTSDNNFMLFTCILRLYYLSKQYDKFIEYYQKINDYNLEEQDEELKQLIYDYAGIVYLNKKDYKKALEFFEHNTDFVSFNTFYNMAICYYYLEDFKKALKFFKKSFNKQWSLRAFRGIGHILFWRTKYLF